MADEGPRGVRIPVKTAGTVLAGPMHEPDIDVVVELTLAQAVAGAMVTTEITRHSPCADCHGSGILRVQGACDGCGGAGVIVRNSGGIAIRQVCGFCDGRGEATPQQCGACSGVGTTARPAQVTIRVPPGVQDGTRLRVPKVGPVERGPDGLVEGDLFAVVRVATHPLFDRRGADLWIKVPITLAEAGLGATILVPSLEGAALTVRVPAASRHGRVLRVRGKGVAHGDNRGNLMIALELDVPAELNDGQRAALERFAAATTRSPRAAMLADRSKADRQPSSSGHDLHGVKYDPSP